MLGSGYIPDRTGFWNGFAGDAEWPIGRTPNKASNTAMILQRSWYLSIIILKCLWCRSCFPVHFIGTATGFSRERRSQPSTAGDFRVIHGLYALFIRLKFGAGSLNCILIFRGIDDAMIHMENSPIQSFFLEVIGFQERMGIMYFAKADRITVAFNAVSHRFFAEMKSAKVS